MSSTKWQLRCAELRQRGAYLYQSKLWSDCTFQVGDVTIKAHKLLLAMASPVFSKMLYGGLIIFPVVIEDVRPEVFNILLEYIYTDNLNLNSSKDACDLYKAAKIWRMPYVANRCVAYVQDHTTSECSDNVCQIYEMVCESGDSTLQHTCEKIFSTRTKEILMDQSFFEADLNTVKKLFSLDPLNIVNELDLFEAAVQYANIQDEKTKARNLLRSASDNIIIDFDFEFDEDALAPLKETLRNFENTGRASDDDRSVTGLTGSPNNSTSDCYRDSATKHVAREIMDKQMYRPLITDIRFLTLTPREFAECPNLSCLLTDAEILALSMNIASMETQFSMPEGLSTSIVPRTQVTKEDRARLAAVFRSIIYDLKNNLKHESTPFYLRNSAWTLIVLARSEDEHVFVLIVTCFFQADTPDWVMNTKVKIKFCTHKPVPKNLHNIPLILSLLTPEYGAWMAKVCREDLLNPDYGFVDDFNTVTYKIYINTEQASEGTSPNTEELAHATSMADLHLSNIRMSKSLVSYEPATIRHGQSALNMLICASSKSETNIVQNSPLKCTTTASQSKYLNVTTVQPLLHSSPNAPCSSDIRPGSSATVLPQIRQVPSATVSPRMRPIPTPNLNQTRPSVIVLYTSSQIEPVHSAILTSMFQSTATLTDPTLSLRSFPDILTMSQNRPIPSAFVADRNLQLQPYASTSRPILQPPPPAATVSSLLRLLLTANSSSNQQRQTSTITSPSQSLTGPVISAFLQSPPSTTTGDPSSQATVPPVIPSLQTIESSPSDESVSQSTESVEFGTEPVTQATASDSQVFESVSPASEPVSEASKSVSQAFESYGQGSESVSQSTKSISPKQSPHTIKHLIEYGVPKKVLMRLSHLGLSIKDVCRLYMFGMTPAAIICLSESNPPFRFIAKLRKSRLSPSTIRHLNKYYTPKTSQLCSGEPFGSRITSSSTVSVASSEQQRLTEVADSNIASSSVVYTIPRLSQSCSSENIGPKHAPLTPIPSPPPTQRFSESKENKSVFQPKSLQEITLIEIRSLVQKGDFDKIFKPTQHNATN